MKHLKLILVLTLTMAMLCGCGGSASVEDLAGEWNMTVASPEEDVTYLLDSMDLYTEERAFVDQDSLSYVLAANFSTDGSYSFTYDVEANKACVREFYEGVMAALYENRAELTSLYGEEVTDMSREAFDQFYAEAYGMASYEVLMNNLVEYAFDYDVLGEPLEVGTFTIVGSNLMCTVEGETEVGSIGFALDGDTLTLTYSDGEEVYTRVK